jgi:trehalose 6-phosphate synthase/phosphatase
VARTHRGSKKTCNINQSVTEGHYRYCNNFLWPIMHDLPQFAIFSELDRSCYARFNLAVARNYSSSSRSGNASCFVQDYQLALVPDLLRREPTRTALFWHIPWPANVNPLHVSPLTEVGRGMLGASFLGFHTREYAHNFLSFIDSHIAEARVDYQRERVLLEGRVTEVIVSPLGIDLSYWTELRMQYGRTVQNDESQPRFILSVDRADYTKGIFERLDAIDQFYESHPEMLGKVHFVNVCHRTREGLPHFDAYWLRCRRRADAISQRWAQAGWRPLIWITEPLEAKDLVRLYSDAAAVMISPIRDGLNLVAKEYSAVQQRGALLLSRGAGVWHELGDLALSVDPGSSEATVSAIKQALTMSNTEKYIRALQARKRLRGNSLGQWWNLFGSLLRNPARSSHLFASGAEDTPTPPRQEVQVY